VGTELKTPIQSRPSGRLNASNGRPVWECHTGRGPALARARAVGWRWHKLSRSDVRRYAAERLGAGTVYSEVPTEHNPLEAYAIVQAPGKPRLVSVIDRYAPGEGRRRVCARLADPKAVAEYFGGAQ